MAAALGSSTAHAIAASAALWGDLLRLRWHRSLSRRGASARGCVLRASSSPAAVTAGAPDEETAEPLVVEPAPDTKLINLACPICYYPLASSSDQSAFECSTCKKSYPNKQEYLDLTVSVGSTEYSESMPAATEFFRTPLISFLYERGWRQNFIWGGFPGLQREFEMAKSYLKPTFGGTIVDASCGSGLFSRLFVKSKLYSLVVALDFSENMLKQCNDFVKQENISDETLALVRADISRLPFMTGSVDAVHAGAALHCWPSPACASAKGESNSILSVGRRNQQSPSPRGDFCCFYIHI